VSSTTIRSIPLASKALTSRYSGIEVTHSPAIALGCRSQVLIPRAQLRLCSEMMAQRGSIEDSDDRALLGLFDAIASRDRAEAVRWLSSSPGLACTSMRVAASRQGGGETFFLDAIRHHVYAGDTALHLAAASYQHELAELLLAQGADVRARNRRGAEPLHYASDGGPDTAHWDPVAQRAVIALLIAAGADPNAMDKSGVAPLHRAVRNRCSGAAGALIDNGADPRLPNKRGSTPLHLAVQNTGKSNSGSEACQREQRRLIALLLDHGASPTDVDANGKSVAAAASSDGIRHLLRHV
jgi:hypothetical protein